MGHSCTHRGVGGRGGCENSVGMRGFGGVGAWGRVMFGVGYCSMDWC